MISKDYCVLGLYDKSYNKWFMSGEKKAWVDKAKVEEKRRYKIKMHMIEDGILTYYDDFDLIDVCYDLKDDRVFLGSPWFTVNQMLTIKINISTCTK